MKSSIYFIMFILLFPVLQAQNDRNDWQTTFEKSGGTKTPRYEETVRYCRQLAAASPMVHFNSFGVSPQGRDLPLMIVDKDGLQEPAAIQATGRLILLVQACIHPGESEGKDAGLMLVRDLVMDEGRGTKDEGRGTRDVGRGTKDEGRGTKGVGDLLEHVTLLFIPIFNVDGHERFGPYNRINQNGPEEMGWRVTATNLNLNRDFLKADATEMKAWLKMYNRWDPDFFIDVHTTDGADYQYVLTYMMETLGQMDPGLTHWCDSVFLPRWTSTLDSAGFPVFPYVQFRRWHDPKSGLVRDVAPPMLSQGYVALRNRPGLLIETHMLKPYKQRVEASYVCLVAAMEILNAQADTLTSLVAEADEYVTSTGFLNKPFPLRFETSTSDSSLVGFKGVDYEEVHSGITKGSWFRYSSDPETFTLPIFSTAIPTVSVTLPEAYIIPVEWADVIERLKLHGIRITTLENDSLIQVTSYKLSQPVWQSNPYEGRHPLTRFEYRTFPETRLFPAGSIVVKTAQPAARVIVQLLEPKGDGSLLSWGFFDAVFEQKEYFEFYVMEPMAQQMLDNDPALKQEFEEKLASDSIFAGNQWQILNWFLEKTPYHDSKRFVYPVGRIEK